MKPVLLLACLSAVWTLTACGILRDAARMRQPEIRLDTVRLAGLRMDSMDLLFGLVLDNPNPVPVTLEAIQYDLFVEGTRFLSGRQDRPYQLNAQGESRIDLPLRLIFSDLFDTYKTLAARDSTAYELRAQLTFQIPVLGYRSANLRHDGRIPVVRPPEVQVDGIRLRRLSMGRADLAVHLRVANTNGFPVGLERLQYDLAVNGRSWAAGHSEEPVNVEANAARTLVLALALDLSELGTSVYNQLLRQQPLDYRLTGELELTTGLSLLKSARLPLDLAGSIGLSR